MSKTETQHSPWTSCGLGPTVTSNNNGVHLTPNIKPFLLRFDLGIFHFEKSQAVTVQLNRSQLIIMWGSGFIPNTEHADSLRESNLNESVLVINNKIAEWVMSDVRPQVNLTEEVKPEHTDFLKIPLSPMSNVNSCPEICSEIREDGRSFWPRDLPEKLPVFRFASGWEWWSSVVRRLTAHSWSSSL